ncbi:MAG: tandem-95 repeat protein, partial [Bacillota bacterium]
GTMGTQQLTFVAGSTLAVDLQGKTPGTGYDQIAVVGTVGLQNASLTLSLGGSLAPGDVFVILRNDGSDPVSGTFAQGGTIVLGPDTFTIDYAYDADGDGNKNDVAVKYVGSTNTPPVAKGDALRTNEDTSLTIAAASLLANDTDADQDPLAIVAVLAADPTKATVELRGDQVIFNPALNFNGTTSFTYTISDGRRGTAVGTVVVTVDSVNDAPTLDAINGNNAFSLQEGDTLTFTATGHDVDAGQALVYSLVNAPAGATIDPATGVFSWTPGYEAAGSYQFNVVVADSGAPSQAASRAVTVTIRDVPLTAPITAPAGGQEGSPLDASYGGVAQAGMSFDWSVRKDGVAYTLPAGTVTSQSTFRFTPSSEGNYELRLLVVDPAGNRTAGVKMVQVSNVAPVVSAGADATVGIGSPFVRSGSFTDPGADHWAATVNYGDNGELPLTLMGKDFVLNHKYALPGTYRVVVTVNDGVDSRSTSFWVTAIETSFRVISVTPTASGFDLDFNRALNTSKLNLYDGLDAAVDLPDMTVVGQKSGAMVGSLIVDVEQPSTLHWVKTGGVLAADDYAVTLFSRSNGFVDATGELLDGDSDGVTGGNYQGSFKVTRSGERIVSLPDLARGPRQSMRLPIRIDNAADVQQVSLELVYDPKLLTINDVAIATGMPAGWNVTKTPGMPGHMTISLMGTVLLTAGARELLSISASVPADAPYAAAQAVQLRGVQINGKQDTAVLGDSAVLVAGYVGDTTGNGRYSGVDASYIAGVSVGLTSGFDAYPRVDPVIIGDATASGTLSSMDASFVAQKSVGLPRPEIPDLPGPTPAAALATKATTSVMSLVASPNHAHRGRSAAMRTPSNSEVASVARLRSAIDSEVRAAFSSTRIVSQEPATATTMAILRRQPTVEARTARAGSYFSLARWDWIFQEEF